MGNPCRWFFNNEFMVHKPEYECEKNIVTFTAWENVNFKDEYKEAFVDFYSAPDCIMTYTNGNTNKDEWLRYWREKFVDLKLKSIDISEDSTKATYTYKLSEVEGYHNGDRMTVEDIPLGKFHGMSLEEYEKYREDNVWNFKWTYSSKKSVSHEPCDVCLLTPCVPDKD